MGRSQDPLAFGVMLLHVMMRTATLFLCLLPASAAFAAALRACYAKADITPAEPVVLVGYDLRGDAPSDGIHGDDKLFIRALVFDDGATKVAFIEGDVIWIQQPDTWRKRIAEATGIPFDNILIGEAHNHAAPSPSPDGKRNWDRRFDEALLSVAKEAAARAVPVKIAAGSGVSRVGINRRKVLALDSESTLTFDENARSQSFGKFKTDKPAAIRELAGDVRLGANPAGPIDEAVQIVRIDTAKGKPLAVMIHYACHGTSLGGRNSKVSGEWMGRMQKHVEDQVSGLGAIYVQGAAGDINPRVVGGLDGNTDDVRMSWALGDEIGREAVRVYRSLAPETPGTVSIEVKSKEILLPRAYRDLFEDFTQSVAPVPTTAVRIGDLMWVTFPGEMFHSIGKRVKAACPARYAHLMGYTNGYIGYLPEQQAYAEGGYEPAVSHLAPVSERIYLREVAELLSRFR